MSVLLLTSAYFSAFSGIGVLGEQAFTLRASGHS